jgi:predicted lactoylglutathione lyase
MEIHGLTPILNVSNILETFEWFAQLGWEKAWDWSAEEGAAPTFGAVGNGKSQIFLCQGGQGARGGPAPQFVGDDQTGGVWMSWWLASPAAVDEAYKTATNNGMTVTKPPTDESWNVREFHLRHPDGHTFRVGAGLEEE